ncbi:MAG TPA: hypothetical protein PLO67_15045 [Saprospiraceae bacterium]|nr:hypothetical protein [Saprospiraceae bacterium]
MKRLKISLLYVLMLAGGSTTGQCPDFYFFYKQVQIDNFGAQYPDCHTIPANIRIETSQDMSDPILNLNGFSGVDSILGYVEMLRSSLADLHGLDSLRYIGGRMKFVQNPLLTGFWGLENLRYIGGSLQIGLETPPQNMQGFNGLERVEQHLEISASSMHSLAGLENLRYVGQNMVLRDMPLYSLAGLPNLDTVQYQLVLVRLHRLKNLEGLENLHAAAPVILECDSLLNLTGLEHLESGVTITLAYNQQLQSLQGLEHFSAFTYDTYPWGALVLLDNPRLQDVSALHPGLHMNGLLLSGNTTLSTCAVDAICSYLAAPGDTTLIGQNGPGCNTGEEILEACSVGTGEITTTDECSVFPNPFSAGQALAITLENDFIGQVKVEIVNLNGRVFNTFFIEKNERKVTRVLPDFPYLDNASTMGWMVRISDELHVQTKLILKL